MKEGAEQMMKKGYSVWTVLAVAGLLSAMAGQIGMAALTEARDTPQRDGAAVLVGVASNTQIYAGALVAINSTGYAVPASDATGLKVVGRAEETVDNTGTAGDGAESITVRRGVFRWTNGDTFTRADVGSLAYVEDDAQVQKAASATYDIVAGVIVDVDTYGVWVDTYTLGSQGNASVVNLAASGTGAITGNATVGGTLAVTGAATLTGNALANELDSRTAATLLLGKATATKVEIADTAVETEIQGPLDAQEAATFASTVGVTGVMTLTAAPKLTAVTSAGSATATMTNAPAAGNPVAWANVSVGTNTYVVPLFAAE